MVRSVQSSTVSMKNGTTRKSYNMIDREYNKYYKDKEKANANVTILRDAHGLSGIE